MCINFTKPNVLQTANLDACLIRGASDIIKNTSQVE